MKPKLTRRRQTLKNNEAKFLNIKNKKKTKKNSNKNNKG
jgi:hypothetical protein